MNRVTRRKFLRNAALGTAATMTFPSILRAQKSQAPSKKYNVLFLMSDDCRVELGCYGSMFQAKTPNLDALAKSGVRFDRNYCQFPLCNPSRSSLLTARPATKTGVLGNRTAFRDLHPDWTSLPQLFRQNGYVAVREGKIFHGGIDDPKAWDAASVWTVDDEGGMQSHDAGRVEDTTQIAERTPRDLKSPRLAGPGTDNEVGRQRAY